MYGRRSTEERTMTLTLGEEEQEVLSRALAHYLNELRDEINHTDDHAFKARLQRQEHVLQGLAARLGVQRSSP
jgi:hypothetical protein